MWHPRIGASRCVVENARPDELAEIYLFPGSGIYGVLRDSQDRPVEGAFVVAEWTGQGYRDDVWSPPPQRSDADGRFALLGLEPGSYRVFVKHSDFAPDAHDVTLEALEDAEVFLYLSAGRALSGRLINENSEPVAGNVAVRALDGGRVSETVRGQRFG